MKLSRSKLDILREMASDVDLVAVARLAQAYLASLDDRPVAPSPQSVARLSTLDHAFPDRGATSDEILTLLGEIAEPATVASAGGRYFGFVTGGTVPAALGAAWLASAWDQNVALRAMSPAAAALEEISLRWTAEALQLPASCGGALVTGATLANFTALAAARHRLMARAGWDVEANGLFHAPELTVVVGTEVHVSLLKALMMLGLGRERVIRVPVDSQGRMRADRLPPLDASTILCLQAGNVNTGAFDPAAEICLIAQKTGAWIHVDGAFGLWAAVSPNYRHLTAGFELADSWATDAHKWPNVGYDCGIALVRDPAHLAGAMAVSAEYLQTQSNREPMHYSPESSRRARGVELWAALRSLGRDGLAELIDRTCRHARRFADELAAAGYLILNDVDINQVLVSFGDSTPRVIAEVQRDGTCWCGATTWQGHPAMRISVSSWATTDQDVERSLAAILRIARSN
jgi:glutamate/tyrosine decarboxylase-like PLP-dependent enzyme